MYQCVCFYICSLSPVPVSLFSRSRLRGTDGARLYSTAQVWVPGGLRGACSGRSKSRHLASNHGVAFRGARAEQDNGNSTCFCSTAVQALYLVAATVKEQSHIMFVRTTTYFILHVCCACYGGLSACGSADLFVCWHPTFFQPFLFSFVYSACCLLLLPYHLVCITPYLNLSSSLLCGSHGTTAVAQQFV